jgi:hypothetical protein
MMPQNPAKTPCKVEKLAYFEQFVDIKIFYDLKSVNLFQVIIEPSPK